MLARPKTYLNAVRCVFIIIVPEFINSFEVGEWVMFFFREIAVEHVNSGEVGPAVSLPNPGDFKGSGRETLKITS